MAPSPWLAVNPAATKQLRLPNPEDDDGLLVTLGFWPTLIGAELRARLRDVSIFKEPAEMTTDALAAQNRYDLVQLSEAARWGVRGWAGDPAAESSDVEIDGRKHTRLSDDSVELLEKNGLLLSAGIQSVLFNMIGPPGKGGSGSP